MPDDINVSNIRVFLSIKSNLRISIYIIVYPFYSTILCFSKFLPAIETFQDNPQELGALFTKYVSRHYSIQIHQNVHASYRVEHNLGTEV